MTESSRGPDGSLPVALRLARRALDVAPAGMLTDFDGTLSPIVADPATARLVAGADAPLERLARRLAVVAVVTGRAPLDARRMIGLDALLVAGNHGTEWLEPRARTPTSSPETEAVRRRLDPILGRVPKRPGVTIEDKGISATVHYRTAPDPASARASILEAIGDPGRDVELRPGRMSVELRPRGLGDKGSAARTIISRYALRGALVMGDDVSDLDMFRAVEQLRSDGRLIGAIVAVGGRDGEVPPEVAAAADVVLGGPNEAAALLAALSA